MLLCMYCLTGCGEEEVEIPNDSIIDEGNKETNPLFEIYHFKDTSNFKPGSLRQANHSHEGIWISGIKNGKAWIGLFNDNDQNQLDEWIGKEDLPNNILQIGIAPPIKTDWGYYSAAMMSNKEISAYVEEHAVAVFDDNHVSIWNTGIKGNECTNINIEPVQNYFIVKPDFANFEYFENLYSLEGKVIISRAQKIIVYYDHFIAEKNNKKTMMDSDGKILHEDLEIYEKNVSAFISYFDKDQLGISLLNEQEGILEEWIMSENFDKDRKYHLGYGDYLEYHINKVYISQVNSTKWGYVITPNYITDKEESFTDDILLLYNKKVYCVQNVSSWESWYNNSILIWPLYQTNDMNKCLVISQEGEKVTEFEENGLDDDFMLETLCSQPSSYSSIIKVTRARNWADYTVVSIDNYDLVKQENIWSVNIDALGSSSVNDRFTTEILEQNKNSWIMEATVTSFDGKSKKAKFELNIETGEITYQ